MRLNAAAHASGSRLFRLDIASRTSSGLTPETGGRLRSARRCVSCFNSARSRGPVLCAHAPAATNTQIAPIAKVTLVLIASLLTLHPSRFERLRPVARFERGLHFAQE